MRTFIFLCILVCILVCIILYKSINFIGETYINYTDLNDKDPEYVFWTGGYDSTFRICELLIIYKRPVQPVYIS